jgi:hypothetical protein
VIAVWGSEVNAVRGGRGSPPRLRRSPIEILVASDYATRDDDDPSQGIRESRHGSFPILFLLDKVR